MKCDFLKIRFVKPILVVAAAIAVSAAAHAARFRSEIYQATNVYVMCRSVFDDCNEPIPKSIQEMFAKKNRWTLVNEPAKADLILVWFQEESTTYGSIGRSLVSDTWRFGSLIVLKGGSTPDWSAVPLYVTAGKFIVPVIQEFYDEVIQTAPPFMTPSALLPPLGKSSTGVGSMNANDYLARGRGWRQRGDLDNAIHDFTTALWLKPDFEEAQRELESAKKAKAAADCHYQLGCPK
jgi:tetratricopeptide (TPR) repeat protein